MSTRAEAPEMPPQVIHGILSALQAARRKQACLHSDQALEPPRARDNALGKEPLQFPDRLESGEQSFAQPFKVSTLLFRQQDARPRQEAVLAGVE